MEDTDWRPSPCPECGAYREAKRNPICTNPSCNLSLPAEEPQDKIIGTAEMRRKADISKDLMVRAMESLIRTTLNPPQPFLPTGGREFRPELRLAMRLRESGLGTLEHGDDGLTLKIYGITATAPSVRGVLWEWAETAHQAQREV